MHCRESSFSYRTLSLERVETFLRGVKEKKERKNNNYNNVTKKKTKKLRDRVILERNIFLIKKSYSKVRMSESLLSS